MSSRSSRKRSPKGFRKCLGAIRSNNSRRKRTSCWSTSSSCAPAGTRLRTEDHDTSNATCGDRGRRFRRIGRRQGSEEDTRESNPDRPYQSPPVSTFALPGGNLGLDARSDCNANPQHSSESEEHYSNHG